MAKAQGSTSNRRGTEFIELQDPEQVGNRGTIQAHPLGQVGLAQTKPIPEVGQGRGTIKRVEIFSLEVLDQGHLRGFLVISLNHNGGNHTSIEKLERPQTPLPCDHFPPCFIAVPRGTNHHRLHQTRTFNGAGQLFQSLLIKARSGLMAVGLEGVNGQQAHHGLAWIQAGDLC